MDNRKSENLNFLMTVQEFVVDIRTNMHDAILSTAYMPTLAIFDMIQTKKLHLNSIIIPVVMKWVKEIYTEQTTKTLIPTVLGVQEIIHLQSFFPDDFKFDPKAVYELFPINGLSLAVNAVSAINPFVTMQRDKKHIASFTFQGFVVRQTLQCLRIKSINRDKYEAPKAPR